MTGERTDGDRGRVLPAVVLGAVLLVGTVVAGAALAGSTDDGPSGETILENAHDRYASTNTLTGTVEITVSNATENRSATIEIGRASCREKMARSMATECAQREKRA